MDAVNDAFHDAYARARDEEAEGPPLFVVVGDVLTLLKSGGRRELTFVPPLSHAIKSAAHAAIACFSMLRRGAELGSFRAKVRSAIADLPDGEDAAIPDMRLVLEQTAAWAPDDDDAARRLGPLLLRLTDHATRLQLAELHACVEEAIAPFTRDERRSLSVVVTGDHQARARNLAMQYFGKRLRETEDGTQRVMYAEGASSVEEAVRLVGVQRFDAVIADAFFGDRSRLQQDVLGDSVTAQLADQDFSPIG